MMATRKVMNEKTNMTFAQNSYDNNRNMGEEQKLINEENQLCSFKK
jgi:hypothetical protein